MVVEDAAGTRNALNSLLQGSPGFLCTGTHGTARVALARIAVEQPQVILVDLELGGMSGVQFIRTCRERHSEIKLVVLTTHGEADYVFPALQAGASGYLMKGTPPVRLLEALSEIAAGGAWMSGQIARLVLRNIEKPITPAADRVTLSPREQEVMGLLAQGLRYEEIALRLFVSARTVNTHLQRIYRKLHVHSATAAISKLSQTPWRPGGPPPPQA